MASVFTRLASIATSLWIVSQSRAGRWIEPWQWEITQSRCSPQAVGQPEAVQKTGLWEVGRKPVLLSVDYSW